MTAQFIVDGDERASHEYLMREYPFYAETATWFPVLVAKPFHANEVVDWLSLRGTRGTRQARNDWMFPYHNLVLIREEQLAVEFKLRWC